MFVPERPERLKMGVNLDFLLRICYHGFEVTTLNSNLPRAEEFLRIYRMVENTLDKRYGDGTGSGSVVYEYIRSNPDSEPIRQELNLCREIRNLLSHNSDAAGEPVVEPSEAILSSLNRILRHVSTPSLAKEYGTPHEQLLSAHANDRVIEIMRRMNARGFSHVPILDGKRLTGVFSVGSLFNYLEKNGFDNLDNDLRIRRLGSALNIEAHGTERYLFMPENTTIIEVRAAFEKRSAPNSRLSAVFITENGRLDEPLLSMLTPWDALKDAGRPANQEDQTCLNSN